MRITGRSISSQTACRRRRREVTFSKVRLLILTLVAPVAAAQISSTKHNLGPTGAFTIKAPAATDTCIFCHSPHDTFMSRPLWNHQPSSALYTPYSSSTLQCGPDPAPSGTTPLCLSCHDGTTPLGMLQNVEGAPVSYAMTGTSGLNVMPAGPTLLGTDLRNDHPVAFLYDGGSDGELASSLAAGNVLRSFTGTGRGNAVQCTSCHDPHTTANPKFLRTSTTNGQLCLRCHEKPGWAGSSHQTSLKLAPGSTRTVADVACLVCHAPHNAPAGAPRLLRDGALAGVPTIERTCYRCHTTGGIAADIQAEIAKPFTHPVARDPGHEPEFTVAAPPEAALNVSRHVECPDCHNPHRVTATNRHEGLRGLRVDGGVIDDVTTNEDLQQHEVCFRCHGDSVAAVIPTPTQSGLTPSNKRREFTPTNSAFHPVGAPGRNTSQNLSEQLASAGLTVQDTLKCSDCHSSEATGATRGKVKNGLTGPHGSTNRAILRANFIGTWRENENPTSFDPDNYALCFLCHDRTRLMARRFSEGARTNFYDEFWLGRGNLHWLHLDDRASKSKASCKNCHFNVHSNVSPPNTIYVIRYPTGIDLDFEAPTDDVNTHLVSFSPDLLPFGASPKPKWHFDVTSKWRSCEVVCHGTAMGGWVYKPPSGDVP